MYHKGHTNRITPELIKDLLEPKPNKSDNDLLIHQAKTWNSLTNGHECAFNKETDPNRPMTKYLDTSKDSMNQKNKTNKKKLKKEIIQTKKSIKKGKTKKKFKKLTEKIIKKKSNNQNFKCTNLTALNYSK